MAWIKIQSLFEINRIYHAVVFFCVCVRVCVCQQILNSIFKSASVRNAHTFKGMNPFSFVQIPLYARTTLVFDVADKEPPRVVYVIRISIKRR